MSAKARVLLIDDERFARQLYSDYLVAAGFDVECAESAQSGVALVRAGRYDVVVTDLLLPDGDGIEVLESVKRVDPELEVVVITGFDRVEPAVRALRAGASDYLVKPVTPDALALAVNRCLSMRRVLRENAALKQSLALFEAAQRLSVATDRARIADVLVPALRETTTARSVALAVQGRDGWEIVRAFGVPEEQLAPLGTALQPVLSQTSPGLPSVLEEVVGAETLVVAGLCATVVPIDHEESLLAAAVLFGEGLPGPGALHAASFLARTAAMTLATVQRFANAERLAFLDDLTHLFNARYLQQLLERDTTRDDAAPFGLLFVDLDHFKLVNDAHGHLVGSRLLVEVGRVLKNAVRERDICVRWGGDEFCVVLRGADEPTSMVVAERVRTELAAHRFLAREGHTLHVTASIGVACYPLHAVDAQALVDLADRAMYRGKRTTRNVVYLASELAA